MFAVFYQDKFIDFWLNLPTDQGWIERTIQLKNWHPHHVEVYQYITDVRGIGPIFFDDGKNVVPLIPQEIEVEINGELQEKTVHIPNHDSKILGICWFKEGERKLNYL